MSDKLGCLFCGKVKRGMHEGMHPMTEEPIAVCRACATKYGYDFSDEPTPEAVWTEEDHGEMIGGFSTVGAVLSA